jgi:site-specific recombinase XerD
MILSKATEQFILHKQSLGMRYKAEATQLRAFVKFIGDRDMRLVKPDPVLKFLEGTGTGPITSFWFSKYHTLKRFYRYAVARQYCASSPLPLGVPQKPEAFEPYIYTNQDMERLLTAADAMPQRFHFGRGIEPLTIRTLLLLLYSTGLRISEALSLLLSDYDPHGRFLTIRETKFFKSRFVPVGSDLSVILQRYIDKRWSGRSCTEETPLFANRGGKPITRNRAEIAFHALRHQAGVYRSGDAKYQPRLHDFRHTFAVVRLVTWYREGKNAQRLLPHLSTYLGHGLVNATQRYLTMTTELLEQASLCYERYARPEVPHA